MAKARGRESYITRDVYNRIKQYDRQQMDDFLGDFYNKAYDKGFAESAKAGQHRLNQLETIEKELAGIKGLGVKRIGEIIAIIGNYFA